MLSCFALVVDSFLLVERSIIVEKSFKFCKFTCISQKYIGKKKKIMRALKKHLLKLTFPRRAFRTFGT